MNKYFSKSKLLLGFALPISGTVMLSILSGVLSILFVAKLGKHELAAAALATSTMVAFMTTARGFFNSIGVLISHSNEKNDIKATGDIFRNGIFLSIIIAALLSVILWNISAVLLFFGQKADLVSLTTPYFHWAAIFIYIISISSVVGQFYIGVGKPRITFMWSAVSSPLTVLLSYALVLGRFGLPQLGLSGIMCASAIAQAGVLSVVLFILFKSEYNKTYKLFKFNNIVNSNVCLKIISMGLPISIQAGGEMIALAVTIYFMGWFGVDALAAAQVVNQYVILGVAFYIGLSQAVSILISKAYANEDYSLIKEYTVSAMFMMLVLYLIIAFIFIEFPDKLIDIFLNRTLPEHSQILVLGRIFFIVAIVTGFADSMRFILSGAYRGLQNTKRPMLVGIFSLWGISIGASYLLGVYFNYGPVGIRVGTSCGIIFALAYLYYDFYFNLLKSKVSNN